MLGQFRPTNFDRTVPCHRPGYSLELWTSDSHDGRDVKLIPIHCKTPHAHAFTPRGNLGQSVYLLIWFRRWNESDIDTRTGCQKDFYTELHSNPGATWCAIVLHDIPTSWTEMSKMTLLQVNFFPWTSPGSLCIVRELFKNDDPLENIHIPDKFRLSWTEICFSFSLYLNHKLYSSIWNVGYCQEKVKSEQYRSIMDILTARILLQTELIRHISV